MVSSFVSPDVSGSVSMDIIRGGGPIGLSIVLLKLFLGVV